MESVEQKYLIDLERFRRDIQTHESEAATAGGMDRSNNGKLVACAVLAVAERLERLVEVQEARLVVGLETQSRIDKLSEGFFKTMKASLEEAMGHDHSDFDLPLRTEEDAPTGGVTGKQYCSQTRIVEGKASVCLLLSNHPGDCIFEC